MNERLMAELLRTAIVDIRNGTGDPLATIEAVADELDGQAPLEGSEDPGLCNFTVTLTREYVQEIEAASFDEAIDEFDILRAIPNDLFFSKARVTALVADVLDDVRELTLRGASVLSLKASLAIDGEHLGETLDVLGLCSSLLQGVHTIDLADEEGNVHPCDIRQVNEIMVEAI